METPRDGRLEDYTLLDVGCGKGPILLMASELPFKEVIGVELNAELARTGEENMTVWKAAGRTKCPVRIVQRDATEIELPEGPCVFYLYNPFEATVLRRLLDRLEAHFVGRLDGFEILYLFPKFDSVFAERKGMSFCGERIFWSRKKIARWTTCRPGNTYAVRTAASTLCVEGRKEKAQSGCSAPLVLCAAGIRLRRVWDLGDRTWRSELFLPSQVSRGARCRSSWDRTRTMRGHGAR